MIVVDAVLKRHRQGGRAAYRL